MSRLRKRELIPEDENIRGVLKSPKLDFGQYGRQVQVQVLVTHGEYKGTEFRDWFSFSKDKHSDEEYILTGSALHTALRMVDPKTDEVLEDDDLSDEEYEQWLKATVKKLDDVEIMGRVGIKVNKNDASKKRNILQPGTFGPVLDPEEGFDDLNMDKKAS
jgi:hypothetical protein